MPTNFITMMLLLQDMQQEIESNHKEVISN
jgi:hypothetical protein